MRIAMLCFSLTGWETGKRLAESLQAKEEQIEITLEGKSRYLEQSISESHEAWTERQFEIADAIIFICACGIAVRSIAPFVRNKKTDPAVLVVDECGKYVISLLSGHLGGANELTEKAAEAIGAIPVITTATDLHQRFAVDVFAKKNQCELYPIKTAIQVSAAILAGEPVGFYSDYSWEGELPEGLILCTEEGFPCDAGSFSQKKPEVGIAVSVRKECCPFSKTLHIIPRIVTVGIGCRKGKEAEIIFRQAEQCLKGKEQEEEASIFKAALEKIASVDLKKEEAGILSLAEQWHLPFVTFSAEELGTAEGTFLRSEFVSKIAGVDNVCERSAVLASGNGRLLRRKAGANGVTTALAEREWRIRFE